jgi:hypothetical protein
MATTTTTVTTTETDKPGQQFGRFIVFGIDRDGMRLCTDTASLSEAKVECLRMIDNGFGAGYDSMLVLDCDARQYVWQVDVEVVVKEGDE